MKLFWKFLLMFGFCALNTGGVFAQSVSVKGSIIIPGSQSHQGLSLTLVLEHLDGEETVYIESRRIQFEENQNSAQYEYQLPQNLSGRRYRVSYENCWGFFSSGQQCGSFSSKAYLGEAGSVYEMDRAKLFTSTQLASKSSFPLLELVPLQLRLNRPTYIPKNQYLNFSFFAEVEDSQGNELGTIGIYNNDGLFELGEDQNQRLVDVLVPPLQTARIRLRYSCFGCPSAFEMGYLGENAAVLTRRNAKMISQGDMQDIIDLKLMESVEFVANISRPEGIEPLSDIDLTITLKVLDDDPALEPYQSEVVVMTNYQTIKAGRISSIVELLVPADPSSDYSISISCYSCFGIASVSHYAEGEMVSTEANQNLLSLDDISSELDLTLAQALILEGLIIRPPELPGSAPISVQIKVVGRSANGGWHSVQGFSQAGIDPSSSQGSFKVSVDKLEGYLYELSYACSDLCGGVSNVGYYRESLSAPSMDAAELLTVEEANKEILFKMIPAHVFSGMAIRPDSSPSNTEVRFSLELGREDLSGRPVLYDSTMIVIPPGVSRVPYSIEIPPREDLKYKISYRCYSCSGVATQGNYRKDGSFSYLKESEPFDLLELSSSIDLPLIGTFKIFGSLLRPLGMEMTQAVYPNVEVNFLSEDGELSTIYTDGFMTIFSGREDSEIDFEVPSIQNGTYSLKYNCSYCDGVWQVGYFTSSGSTFIEDSSAQLHQEDFTIPLDFRLIGTVNIDGLINLPPELVDRPFLVRPMISVSVLDTHGNQITESGQQVRIEPGDASSEFNIAVPDSKVVPKSYRLSYECFSCPQIVGQGFYSDQGAVLDIEQAQLLDQSVLSQSALKFDLIPYKTIKLRLKRPSDQDGNSRELQLEVDLAPIGTEFGDPEYGITESEIMFWYQRSLLLNFNLLPNGRDQYRIRYRCLNCSDTEFHSEGYLGENKIVYLEESASNVGAKVNSETIEVELALKDSDGDLVPDKFDNCADVINPDQLNFDRDAYGDECDWDIDGDGVLTGNDFDDYDQHVCGFDIDGDGCDDCLSGRNNPLDDGEDLDGDGVCVYNPEVCFPVLAKNKGVSMVCF